MNIDKKISLTFKDSKLEKIFKKSHDKKIKGLLRSGILQSLFFWIIGVGIIYKTLPQQFPHFSVIILFAIGLPFSLIYISTYSKKLSGCFHQVAAVTNALAGLVSIYICHNIVDGVNIMLMILIFMAFFGNYLYRLRFFTATFTTLSYMIPFQFYILFVIDLETSQIIILSFITWLTESFAISSSFITEKNQRESFIQQETIKEQKAIILAEKEASEKLLLNILPSKVAQELKDTGKSEPRRFERVTILFTDFQGFTEKVANMSAITLVNELNDIFSRFDDIMDEVGIEKIETIGDAYLAACGVPEFIPDHASRCILAAKMMVSYLTKRNKQNEIQWNMRIGLHSGSIVAGVVGKKKFAYDVFGDAINTASRIESAGEPGKINISASTYELIKDQFNCEYRGKFEAKGKGDLDMYFVE